MANFRFLTPYDLHYLSFTYAITLKLNPTHPKHVMNTILTFYPKSKFINTTTFTKNSYKLSSMSKLNP